MSLNDGALDDIDNNGVVDEDVIHSPNVVEKSGEQVTIIPVTPELKANKTDLSELDIAKLPTMDVEFKIVNDQSSKIVELSDIESDIIGQESIDRNNAKVVNELFGTELSLEQFTTNKTKVNYSDTVRVMKLRLAQEHEALAKSISTYLSGPVADAKVILEKLKIEYIPVVMDSISVMQYRTSTFEQKMNESKNAIVPYSVSFVDIFKFDLLTTEVDEIEFPNTDLVSKLVRYTANLKEFFKIPLFKAFFFQCLDGKDDGLFNSEFSILDTHEYNSRCVSIADLAKFYSLSTVGFVYDRAIVNVNDLVKKMSDLEESLAGDSEKVREYITNNTKDILTLHRAIEQTISITNVMIQFGVVSDGLIDTASAIAYS